MFMLLPRVGRFALQPWAEISEHLRRYFSLALSKSCLNR